MKSVRETLRREDGVAAVEFALVLPVLLVLLWGIVEITHRIDVANDVRHYNYQVGDYLSRQFDLSSDDIDDVYDWRNVVMQGTGGGTMTVSLRIASIGYDDDDDPVLLWSKTRGPAALPIDLNDADGLADHGQSVILVRTRLSAPSVFSDSNGATVTSSQQAFFRPRETRAIAFGGSLSEGGATPDGYEDDDD